MRVILPTNQLSGHPGAVHLWRTPHGQALLVDHTGTHRINPHEASAMADAIDDGIELYFASALPYAPA